MMVSIGKSTRPRHAQYERKGPDFGITGHSCRKLRVSDHDLMAWAQVNPVRMG